MPAAATEPAAPAAANGRRIRRVALTALALLAIVYVALAVPVAAPHSTVVLAAGERSPDWLLGPWRVLGAGGADGRVTGPLFYAGLWAAMLAYVVVLGAARAIGPRLALGSIAAFHVLFLLAPPLLSQDVFSYISYARLDVLHGLSPYTHSPDAVPQDAAFAFAGSRDATSVYGPLFTLATYPLAKVGVPVAFWALKAVAALASAGVVALTWRCASALGRDPTFAALVVGLNPLVLVHVVGGAHNDALMMLLVMGGVTAALLAREQLAGALVAVAVAVKASAGLVLPFLVIGARRRAGAIAAAAIAALAVLALSLAVLGTNTFDAFGLIGQNQERTTRWSVPQRLADGVAGLTGGSTDTVVHFTRALLAAGLIAVLALLLYRTYRAGRGSAEWIAAVGWATLALLVASAWLVPWYAIWLLPFAALSASRRLIAASLALCAYMLVIAVPL